MAWAVDGSTDLNCIRSVSDMDKDEAREIGVSLPACPRRNWFLVSSVSNTGDGGVELPDELKSSSAYSAPSSTCFDTSVLNVPRRRGGHMTLFDRCMDISFIQPVGPWHADALHQICINPLIGLAPGFQHGSLSLNTSTADKPYLTYMSNEVQSLWFSLQHSQRSYFQLATDKSAMYQPSIQWK